MYSIREVTEQMYHVIDGTHDLVNSYFCFSNINGFELSFETPEGSKRIWSVLPAWVGTQKGREANELTQAQMKALIVIGEAYIEGIPSEDHSGDYPTNK